MTRILEFLDLQPAPLSRDYVENRRQFHLFSLLTEQRHPKTWNLSFALQSDVEAGLRMLASVDRDVSDAISNLAGKPDLLFQAADAVAHAILTGRQIYIYGCGATGRLAKQMESSFWRPFWKKVRMHPCWEALRLQVGADIENRLIGEMTGGDRALVSSLEGFEDLPLIGKLQLQDHGIRRGDVVICVTEGGETSSVIGTILSALSDYEPLTEEAIAEARAHLYFVCNNPVEVLLPFARSAEVLSNPAITHIDLTTGPQAITGSTRMQATTIETYVVGMMIEQALRKVLAGILDPRALCDLGFPPSPALPEGLREFEICRQGVEASLVELARFTGLEAEVYRQGRFSTYLANEALITVFIDSTERSPTFRLYPLDRVDDAERRCWVRVWSEAPDLRAAWQKFLGRPFHGLDPSLYRSAFETLIQDEYLQAAALRSLAGAGNDQELLYDFSFSRDNIARGGPGPGDLGVLVLVEGELNALEDPASGVRNFIDLFHGQGGSVAIVAAAGDRRIDRMAEVISQLLSPRDAFVPVRLNFAGDPLGVRGQVALKMLLNAHSTAVMAILGRVIGNTMTGVSPSNLKLIGRATYLIQSHVNDILARPEWRASGGLTEPLSFAEANAVLIDAVEFVKSRDIGQTAEVALSIIRILESFKRRAPVSWEEAARILAGEGLAGYLMRHNESLKCIVRDS
jgi:N-acetylmuramic acid 6-phosphate (MurNAc-6-P) etherase